MQVGSFETFSSYMVTNPLLKRKTGRFLRPVLENSPNCDTNEPYIAFALLCSRPANSQNGISVPWLNIAVFSRESSSRSGTWLSRQRRGR